jgi:hypothetical protein
VKLTKIRITRIGKGHERLFQGSFANTTVIHGRAGTGKSAVLVDTTVLTTNFDSLIKSHREHLEDNRPAPDVALSPALEYALALMSKSRRDDVLNDLSDWYGGWLAAHGRFSAHLICWWKVGAVICGGLLDFASRLAEIVGKVSGAK